MRRWKRALLSILVLCGLGTIGNSCSDLLGVPLDFPQIVFDTNGVMGLQPNGTLLVDAEPVAIRLEAGGAPARITGDRKLDVAIRLNEDCSLDGGTGGADIEVDGDVDLGPLGSFSGQLLAGEVLDFASRDSGGPTDEYEILSSVLQGELIHLYEGKNLLISITSPNSNFEGDCSVTFEGDVLGTISATPIPQ